MIYEVNDVINVGDMLACSDTSGRVLLDDGVSGAAPSPDALGFDTEMGLAEERPRALIEMYGGRTDVAREDMMFLCCGRIVEAEGVSKRCNLVTILLVTINRFTAQWPGLTVTMITSLTRSATASRNFRHTGIGLRTVVCIIIIRICTIYLVNDNNKHAKRPLDQFF